MAADSQWFLCFMDTLLSGRRQIRRPSQRVGNASDASGVGSATTLAMSLLECSKRRRSEISWRSSSWNLACLSLRISPFVSFVPYSMGQSLGTCRAPLLEEGPQHHGHKGDPGVTPGTCGAIGERAQVILVWVRAPGHSERLPPTETRSHEG